MTPPTYMCCACAEAHDPLGEYRLAYRDGRRAWGRCYHCGCRTQRQRTEPVGDGGQR